jgi:hypothetical protein
MERERNKQGFLEHNPNCPIWKRSQRLVKRWEKENHYADVDATWDELLAEMGSGPNADRLPNPPSANYYRE